MDMKCIQHSQKDFDMDEFKKVSKPLIDWIQENCDPHYKAIVTYGGAELVGGEMGFTVEVPD